MKDNFSIASGAYAQYRPQYPDAFFEYLHTLPVRFERAWDCGTGNGQLASKLANYFSQVFATDISPSQLDHAVQLPNITYSLQPAEATSFPADFFDLVIAGQAVHWFGFDKFYTEVRRTARPGAMLVLVGYNLPVITPAVDAVVMQLYRDILGLYWDQERKYVDEGYRTLPFPFAEVKAPPFMNEFQWTLGHFKGYLQTWSALKHYVNQHGVNPIKIIETELEAAWGDVTWQVQFPLLLRIGAIHGSN